MGNTKSISISSDSPVTLAMMAVAMNFELKRVQLIALRNAMAGFSDERGMIDREGFEKALELANLSSVEIFDLLFTMWDNAGNDQVPFKDFCVGISPMACPHDDVHAILRFSLRVSDDDNRGSVMLDDLRRLLSCINSTASYFGDAHLSWEDIEKVVEAVFDTGDLPIVHEDCIRRLASNAYVKRFVSGKTRQHVQFKEELVTEMIFQTSHDLHSPNDPIDQWRSGHLWGIDKEKAALRWQTRQIVASLLDLNGSWESTGSTSNKKYHPDPPSSQNPTYSVNKNRPSAAKASLSLRQQDPPTKLQA